MIRKAVTKTKLPLKVFKNGKVRDIYLYGEKLIIVATDRISAFDVILPDGIPGKGSTLTKLSNYWFDYLLDKSGVENHFITNRISVLSSDVGFAIEEAGLGDSWMMVEKYPIPPVECVARGYLYGSGLEDYKKNGKVCGIELKEGLQEASKLETPIFTPATKAEEGDHDENIDMERMTKVLDQWLLTPEVASANINGTQLAYEMQKITLQLYCLAHDHAMTKGIIISDTKLEFGLTKDGKLVVVDEIFTPDSSRFWPEDDYEEGRSQKSFDKQFVRDYLLSLSPPWDKKPPAPNLPPEIIAKTAEKYQQALTVLTS